MWTPIEDCTGCGTASGKGFIAFLERLDRTDPRLHGYMTRSTAVASVVVSHIAGHSQNILQMNSETVHLQKYNQFQTSRIT